MRNKNEINPVSVISHVSLRLRPVISKRVLGYHLSLPCCCIASSPNVTRLRCLLAVGNHKFMAALNARCAGCAHTTRPHLYAYVLVNDAQAMKMFSRPRLFLSPSCYFSLVIFLSTLYSLLTSFLSSTQHINDDLHPRIIQILCLHISHSTPLLKTLTVNHYLCIKYFQH